MKPVSHYIRIIRKSLKDSILWLLKIPSLLDKHGLVILSVASVFVFPFFIRFIIWSVPDTESFTVQGSGLELESARNKISREIAALERSLDARRPRSYYLVINSASNEFELYRGTDLIKRDKCSTGSYILLKNGDQQQWMFKTPKGEFRIRHKTISPVWKKPDWAFIEEGLPVPPENHHTRFEYSVLGDYALSIGDGYLIHGTLYQRFLGLPVTHGCIRLNDENLELVFRSLQVGSKVYIF